LSISEKNLPIGEKGEQSFGVICFIGGIRGGLLINGVFGEKTPVKVRKEKSGQLPGSLSSLLGIWSKAQDVFKRGKGGEQGSKQKKERTEKGEPGWGTTLIVRKLNIAVKTGGASFAERGPGGKADERGLP